MENCYLQSSSITAIPSSLLPSKPFIGKTSVHGHSLKFPNLSKFQNSRKLNILHVKATASARGAIGVAKFSSQAVEVSVNEVDAKDENIAFVAGATGKVGSRTVRELLKLGFRVRAGVRSAQRAGSLVQSVKQMKIDVEGAQPVEKLEIVECDLEKPSQIGAAIGDASVVLCCIGASEKEVFDITGPYRIDYMATKNLVDAATAAKVKHFIMVSSLGTNKFGFPAAVLNLFWGVLCWKRKAEEALEASGVPYTIVRPGGMERPTDAYKETHNITLSKEDTLFGGQVSNLQVAELIAFMAQNRSLSYCKVVEVVAETTAPLTPLDKLLARIPSKRIEPKEPTAAPPKNVVPEPTVPPKEKEPEPTVPPKEKEPEPTIPPKEKEPEQAKVTDTRPLSPYSAYEDWKPPTSPTPTQSTGKKEDIKAAPADVVVPEPSPVEEAKIERPLSPYAMYEDLKPPASPTPTPPSGKKGDAEHIEEILFTFDSEAPAPVPAPAPADVVVPKPSPVEEAKIERPLSPYAMYEDLKPPASPTPTPPSGKKEETEHIEEILFTFDSEAPAPDPTPTPAPAAAPAPTPAEAKVESPLSPYTAYDDLKPPTSPTPSKPMGSPVVITSMNGGPATSSKDEPSSSPKIEQQLVEAKPTPLSPYTMYEDLKPPTTPTPSSP